MIYRLIAFVTALTEVLRDAHALRATMHRKHGWMTE